MYVTHALLHCTASHTDLAPFRQVAFKRILDTVPLHIREYLLHNYADRNELPRVVNEKVVSGLEEGKGVKEGNLFSHVFYLDPCLFFVVLILVQRVTFTVPAELCNLMQEDPAISGKRRQLQDLSGRLEKAVKVLQLQHPGRQESFKGA